MIKDQDLKEIEMLIIEMGDLEQRILRTKEQQQWVDDMVAHKQRQCQEAKEQHEERIRQITRQARKNRSRSNRSKYAAEGPTVEPEVCGLMAGAGPPIAGISTQQLDEVLGVEERTRLLDAAGNDEAAAVATIVEALETRLNQIRSL